MDTPDCPTSRIGPSVSEWLPGRYNSLMAQMRFEEIKRFVGFEDADAARLRSLRPDVEPILPAVVECFYRELVNHPTARAVFTGGDAQMARLRKHLRQWLNGLFAGLYDDSYYTSRLGIGGAHVREGLPQHFMLLGMELIWHELERSLRAANVEQVDQKLRSLHKLLTLELVTMLESYKESYAQEIRHTERSAVEEKLTRAAHLAEVGQLAASLAHEIKNPLAGISGAIQILRDDMASDDPHQPVLKEILGQIGRLDATVKDLLQYARPSPPHAKEVSLHDAITRVLAVLREEPALQEVQIKFDGAASRTSITADEAQIEQLLLNLLLNAAHASQPGGTVHLDIEDNSTYVRLIIADTGKGMTPEVRDRAFEPFFTTKAKGTGLGLSICRRITDVHRGRIDLLSEPGRGTTVIVDLPRSSESPKQEPDR